MNLLEILGIAFLCCLACSLLLVAMCVIDGIKNAPTIKDEDYTDPIYRESTDDTVATLGEEH